MNISHNDMVKRVEDMLWYWVLFNEGTGVRPPVNISRMTATWYQENKDNG